MLVVATSEWMFHRLQAEEGGINVEVAPTYLRRAEEGQDQQGRTHEPSPRGLHQTPQQRGFPGRACPPSLMIPVS